MTILNLYTHKGNLSELTELQLSRFTEIEIWLLWKKLRNYTHYSKHTEALHFLQVVIDPDNELDFIALSKLTDYLTKSEILVPTQDEMVVYLRFQGLGLNKVTKATGRQHQYMNDMLSNYDTNTIIPALTFDFKFIDHPKLMSDIFRVSHEVFHIHLDSFYSDMDMRHLKQIERNKFFNR